MFCRRATKHQIACQNNLCLKTIKTKNTEKLGGMISSEHFQLPARHLKRFNSKISLVSYIYTTAFRAFSRWADKKTFKKVQKFGLKRSKTWISSRNWIYNTIKPKFSSSNIPKNRTMSSDLHYARKNFWLKCDVSMMQKSKLNATITELSHLPALK